MSGNVLNKMMGFLGLEDDYDEIQEDENVNEANEEQEDFLEPTIKSPKKQGKVVNIHTAASAKIVIVKPSDYEEAANICDNLRNRKIILVNTNGLEAKVAQRLLDFMGGASYALDGDLQEVDKGIYILSPSNVEVSSDFKSELSSKGMFNWSK